MRVWLDRWASTLHRMAEMGYGSPAQQLGVQAGTLEAFSLNLAVYIHAGGDQAYQKIWEHAFYETQKDRKG